jgi:hypothetical protein
MVVEEVLVNCLQIVDAKENLAAVILCTVNLKFFPSWKIGFRSGINLSGSTTIVFIKIRIHNTALDKYKIVIVRSFSGD